MKLLILISAFVLSVAAHAVVMRHDVPPEHYALDEAPGYLVDLPHEGHGVLIAPRWVVTVAHTIFYDYTGKQLTIGSHIHEIEHVIRHPDYAEPDKELFEGDAAPLMAFFESRSDIALIKLTAPVADVKPIRIYTEDDEQDKTITVYGKGATGNGLTGEQMETKPLRKLYRFTNVINSVDGHWLSYQFDQGEQALPLEGMHGSGDSGSASIIVKDGTEYLIGLSSWQRWQGDLASFKGGLYGTTACQVRVASYRAWINSVISE